jgi:hypothetical protein
MVRPICERARGAGVCGDRHVGQCNSRRIWRAGSPQTRMAGRSEQRFSQEPAAAGQPQALSRSARAIVLRRGGYGANEIQGRGRQRATPGRPVARMAQRKMGLDPIGQNLPTSAPTGAPFVLDVPADFEGLSGFREIVCFVRPARRAIMRWQAMPADVRKLLEWLDRTSPLLESQRRWFRLHA